MKRTTTCNCGRTSIQRFGHWDSYDQPYQLPRGWRWGAGRLDAPVCPDCSVRTVAVQEKQS
jgi:hypothetical protein